MGRWRDEWTAVEWLTLRLAPVWVLSALSGRVRFDEDERGAFWDAATSAALRSEGPGRDVLAGAAAERTWLFDEFELDGRSVVSGMLAVTRLLERMDARSRDDVRRTVLRIGEGVALARGPFGRRILPEDEQTLILVGELLRTASETAADNPLDSPAAI